ncbi:ankyrin repeat-containing protein BDA1-like [Castanea sativa]|uniref:ankyrin repeat-containing protein BDA1-like n=1 Tax=Castanea sativa TaxID=21020 RepID=UPI003F64E59E
MDERLEQVAESRDIIAMHQLIGEDVNLLDHIDEKQFVQTPLHIAAFAGKIQFATEVMGLKPSFARKLNPDGFTPIHLALKNGHIELVRQLLEIDRDLAHVKGKECITPLHYVVETGDWHIDLLDNFLLVSPNSIAGVTVHDETTLHIALKNEQLKAFKFLVGWLGRNLFKNTSLNVFSVLNQKDDEGNNVLHIVVSKNETQVVSHLLSWGFRFVDVNSTNLEGKTAWDITQGQIQVDNKEIKLLLYGAGASSSSSLSTKLDPNEFSPIHLTLQNGHIELVRWLLQLDGDLVRVKGREWLTLLHYIFESGEHLYLLDEFLLVCPDSITDVTVRNETDLHIALKNDLSDSVQYHINV